MVASANANSDKIDRQDHVSSAPCPPPDHTIPALPPLGIRIDAMARTVLVPDVPCARDRA